MPSAGDDHPAVNCTHVASDTRASLRQILELLDRLAEVAQGSLPPGAKLELLCTLIGTTQVWCEPPGHESDSVESLCVERVERLKS